MSELNESQAQQLGQKYEEALEGSTRITRDVSIIAAQGAAMAVGKGAEAIDKAFDSLMALMDKIDQKAQDKNIKADQANVSIQVGGRNVYRQVPGKKPEVRIGEKQAATINQAIEDIQATKGSIKIFINDLKKPVSHFADGAVVKDDLNLLSALQAQQPQQSHQAPQVAPVTPDLRTSLEEKIATLTQKIESQQGEIAALRQKLEQFQRSPAKAVSQSVKLWMDNTRMRFAGAVTDRLDQVSNSIKEKHGLLKTQAQGVVAEAQQKVSAAVQAVNTKANEIGEGVKATAQAQVEDLAVKTMSTVIEPSIKLMLEKIGQRQPDGSLSFESRDYRYEQRNDRVSIIPKDGRPALTPANMQSRDMQVALAVSEKVQAKFGQGQTQRVEQGQTQQKQSPPKITMK